MRTLVDRLDTWSAIEKEWTRVYERSDAAFFLSPTWQETLLSLKPATIDTYCVRVFDDLRGVYGVALASTAPRAKFTHAREARLHESADASLDRIYVEYNDILLERDAPAEAREAAIEALIGAMPAVEEFVFRNMRPAFCAAAHMVAERLELSLDDAASQPTYSIDLGGDPFDQFSHALRAKIRRAIRRYEERGPVRLVRPESEGERAVAWTELMRLHAQTWSRRGVEGAFGARDFTAFHERLVERHPEKTDFLRILAGDETIGVLYNIIDRDAARNYQSGFQYESDNQLAPGFVAHALAAQRYRERGFSSYDMMAGDAEYKRRLGAKGESLTTIVLTRPTMRMKVRAALKSARRGPDA